MEFCIPAEELYERCRRRAMKYWDRLPVWLDPEDIAQTTVLIIIRQGLLGPGTDMKLVTWTIKKKTASAMKECIGGKLERQRVMVPVEEYSDATPTTVPVPGHMLEVRELLGVAVSILVPKQQERVEKYLVNGDYSYAGDIDAQRKEMGTLYPARQRMKWWLEGLETREAVKRRLAQK